MTSSDISLFLQILAALGPVLTFAALWWLSRYFAPKADFDALREEVRTIRETLIKMSDQQEQLDDHESRLRTLEARR